MTVCRYFLEGRCRFGNNCWNEHPQSNRIHDQGFRGPPRSSNRFSQIDSTPKTSGLNSFSFKLPPASTFPAIRQDQGSHGGNDSTTDVINFVVSEMTEYDRGKMWFLSTFGPFRMNSNLSGFDDLSPEELRWGFYQTNSDDSMRNEYLSLVLTLNGEQRKRVHEILRPDQFTKSMLIKLYNGEHVQTLGTSLSMMKFLNKFIYKGSNQESESFKLSLDEAKGPSTFKFVLDSTTKSNTETVEEMMTQDIPANNAKLGGSSSLLQTFKFHYTKPNEVAPPKAKNNVDSKTSFLYTPLSSLTEEELAQFSATKFELGKIPSRPPPQDLCY